jgi:hypothetical protein
MYVNVVLICLYCYTGFGKWYHRFVLDVTDPRGNRPLLQLSPYISGTYNAFTNQTTYEPSVSFFSSYFVFSLRHSF